MLQITVRFTLVEDDVDTLRQVSYLLNPEGVLPSRGEYLNSMAEGFRSSLGRNTSLEVLEVTTV